MKFLRTFVSLSLLLFSASALAATPTTAVCDGSTDDTVAINADEAALSAAGGGILEFPAGTCIVTGVTKRANTIWQGAGIGVTVIKLKDNTVADAVVSGLDAYSLFGSGSHDGIANWGLRDLTVDGNKDNGGEADCIGVYGWAWNVRHIEAQNCTGYGFRTEYPIAVDGSLPDHSDNASAWLENSLIHDADLGGILWAGPQDSSLVGNYVYRNLVDNIRTSLPGGVALKITNTHAWGSHIANRQPETGLRLDTVGNMVVNSLFEGATGQQVWIRSTTNSIIGGWIFYANATPNSVYGIRLGDTASGISAAASTIVTKMTNVQAGSVFFDKDNGLNTIIVNGFNSTPGTVGYAGTKGPFSAINIAVAGASVTNAKLLANP